MSVPKYPNDTFSFPNDDPIKTSFVNASSYMKTSTYDKLLMTRGFVWHMVLIHHRGKYRKKAILQSIFQTIGDEEFFPMVYQEGLCIDRFLVRQCQAALERLFSQNLYLTMPNGQTIKVEVILNVAQYKYGQISPTRRIEKALSILFQNLDPNGILNLSEFAKNPEFSDIVINMHNKAVLEVVCMSVFRNEEQFRRVKGLVLSDNRINTLQPLKVFNGCDFDLLDLSGNLLQCNARICKELKEIKMNELILARNPVTEDIDYPLNMKNLFQNLIKLDGKTLPEMYTMTKQLDDEDMSGKLIDPAKPNRIKKFKNNDDWNSITIPTKGIYTKRELLDVFFSVFPPELSEIYPCNYKEEPHEHTFLVRECYNQLSFLVNECQLKIPSPKANGSKLNIYLRMKVKSFESHPFEAIKALAKALQERFIEKGRLLNLEDFNSANELGNVELNMQSSLILNRVLTQASNRFAKKIFELRLGRNRITSCNSAKPFIQMTNLKVLDLSNNLLKDFNDIFELEKLPIKSLSLTGNPLCEQFTYTEDYIKAAKAMFPDITKLDKIEIQSSRRLAGKKNFLRDLDGYDLVQQFVSHYFPLFDSDNRFCLKDMYHPRSTFSVSCNYNITEISVSAAKRVAKFTNLSRNILKMSDFSRAAASMYGGRDEIFQAFMSIPKVEHDIVGFTTDVTILTEDMVTITVTGIMKDTACNALDPDIILAFVRTFILMPVVRNTGLLKCATEYQVINDMLSISTPSEWQKQSAFKYARPLDMPSALMPTQLDKEGLLIMFQELTMLKSIWCRRILDEGQWDFTTALKLFTEDVQSGKIPVTAFLNPVIS